jgi:hypothetical protein
MRSSAASFVFIAVLLVAGPAICSDMPPEMKQLTSAGIKKTIIGHSVRYSPELMADAGMSENFYPGGKWDGMRAGRGPIGFFGRWYFKQDQLCVVEDKASPLRRAPTPFCRTVWQDPGTGLLVMGYLGNLPQNSFEHDLQLLIVERLPPPSSR